MSASTLAKCVSEAQAKGWDAGVMFWEWTDVSEQRPVFWQDLKSSRRHPVSWRPSEGNDLP